MLLALGEREGASGRDLLLAAWLSYEILTRFTESIPGRSLKFRGWNLDTRASFVVPLIAGRLRAWTPARSPTPSASRCRAGWCWR